jgi:4-hydroxybenzoate polyprenyltransferase
MSAGLAMVVGFAIAVIITLFQWLTAKESMKGWQTTGPLIVIGAIVGLFVADTTRFSVSITYFLTTFSILFGAVFGMITGYVLNKLADYNIVDSGKPKEVESIVA